MDLDSAQAPKGPPDFGRSRFHFLSVNGCQSKLLSTSIYSEATSPEKTLDWNWFPPAKGLNISVGYPLSLLETLRCFSHEQKMHKIVDIRWPLPTNMLLAFSIPRGTMQCNRLIYPTGKTITLRGVKAHDPKWKMLIWEKVSSHVISDIWIQNTKRVDVDAALKNCITPKEDAPSVCV